MRERRETEDGEKWRVVWEAVRKREKIEKTGGREEGRKRKRGGREGGREGGGERERDGRLKEKAQAGRHKRDVYSVLLTARSLLGKSHQCGLCMNKQPLRKLLKYTTKFTAGNHGSARAWHLGASMH